MIIEFLYSTERTFPNYEIPVYDNFTTANDEPLTASCVSGYAEELEIKALEMVMKVNGEIDSKSVCNGTDDVRVVTATSAFTEINGAVRSNKWFCVFHYG